MSGLHDPNSATGLQGSLTMLALCLGALLSACPAPAGSSLARSDPQGPSGQRSHTSKETPASGWVAAAGAAEASVSESRAPQFGREVSPARDAGNGRQGSHPSASSGHRWRYQPPWAVRSFPGSRVIEDAVLRHVNRLRRRLGLHLLTMDERLRGAARQHTQEMARLGYYAHSSPVAAWREPRRRACRAGYLDPFVSENIGLVSGYRDVARALFESWRKSPGHYRNMVDTQVSRIGVGAMSTVRGGREVWLATQVFGALPLDIRRVEVRQAHREVLRVEVRFSTLRPLHVDVWQWKHYKGRVTPANHSGLAYRYRADLPLPIASTVSIQFALTAGRETPLVCAEVRVDRGGRVSPRVVGYHPLCRQVVGFAARARRIHVQQRILSFQVRPGTSSGRGPGHGAIRGLPHVRFFLNRTFGPGIPLRRGRWARVSQILPGARTVHLALVVDRAVKEYLLLRVGSEVRFVCP